MSNTAPVLFRPSELEVFRARPRISTVDWAKKNMRMVSGPYKGQAWNIRVTPYAKGIMDAFDRRHVRKLFLIAPSQVGKSTVADACFFSALSKWPDNWGIGMPDIEAVRKYFTGRLAAWFQLVPDLRRLLRGKDSLNNFFISLQGGASVLGMWSGSDSSMRAESMPLVLIEEEDAFADPGAAQIMEERTTAYDELQKSKIIRVCRPKGSEDQSSIWNAAKAEAQAWCVYEARCPVCQYHVRMEHGQIEAISGSTDPRQIRQEKLGRYRCPKCGNLWTDALRNIAIEHGRWVSTTGDMEDATILAFHLRQWESPLVSLSEVLAKWFEARRDPRRMQLWDNNVCAKPYKFVQLETDDEALTRRIAPDLPPGMVPDWAVALTFSADMQMDHFFYSVAAHGLGPAGPERLHILDYGRVATFHELESLVFGAIWRKADGSQWRVWRGALDTGGTVHERSEDSRTVQAYSWLRGLRPGVMFGTKGMSRERPGVLIHVTGTEMDARGRRLPHGLALHLINGGAFKRLAFWRLAEGAEEEPISFHSGTTQDYLRQIASERLEKDKRGIEIWKRFRANHYLDCLVGHLALEHWQWAPSLQALAGQDEGGEA